MSIFLKKGRLRWWQSHPLWRTCFSQYHATSAALGQLGDELLRKKAVICQVLLGRAWASPTLARRTVDSPLYIYIYVRSYSYDKLWQLEHILVQLSSKTVAMRETKIVTCCQSTRMDMCTCRSTQGTEKYWWKAHGPGSICGSPV